ncbi:MAG TPA: hypothetical protein VFJ57_14075 [Solirubrobacterales bacterium]|nr:hypothetical protein [Solirubrobacterales bacterium]
MSDAVEHADVVIVLLDGDSAVIDTELGFAYNHRRPIVGLGFAGENPQSSPTRAMLGSYDRGRIVECEDLEECAAGLRRVLLDTAFIALVDEAAAEVADRV